MEKTIFNVKKSQVECYKLRCETFYWADITLDSSKNAGRIQIASDFGDWQYYWGSCGTSFKEFLIGLNIDYAAGKFGAARWFDLDATIQQLRSNVTEYTSNTRLKQILDKEISDLADSSGKEEFVAKMWNSGAVMEMENSSPDMVYGITPGFKRFWTDIWPFFIEELKKEISELVPQ